MPTYFGSTSVPADNGSNATSTITLTPPASMNANDLAVVFLSQRGNATFSVGVDGGQTWTDLGKNDLTSNVSNTVFWATFNGTWSANPRFDFSASTNTSAFMIVFRPDNTSNQWYLDGGSVYNFIAAAPISMPARTPLNAPNINIASWMTADDNTWGNLAGTNWVKTSLQDQYRNLAGQDSSMTFAYQSQTTAANTNQPAQTQLTLGNDDTCCRIMTFYEAAPPVGGSYDPFGMMGYFGM